MEKHPRFFSAERSGWSKKPASPLNVCRIYHQALIQQCCHSTVPDMAATACIIAVTCISGVQLQQSLSCTQTKIKLHLHTRPALPCDNLTADRAYQEYLAERIIVSHHASRSMFLSSKRLARREALPAKFREKANKWGYDRFNVVLLSQRCSTSVGRKDPSSVCSWMLIGVVIEFWAESSNLV